MSIPSLSGSYIDQTYQRLVQTNDTGTEFADGLGRVIAFGGATIPGGPINSLQFNKDNTNFSGSANLTFSGSNTLTLTGSLNISGSTLQIGNNTLIGNTTLSGSIIMSGSTTTPTTPTIKIYGDMETDGVIKFMPVSKNIDTSISASYIFVSGSTNDLYFSQNGNGYNNVTRLRWLESNLYTGLLHGGIISQVNSNTYRIGSGSGIIVDLNVTVPDDPYPVVQFLEWGNLTNTIDALSGSFDQQFVAINSSNQIYAQGIPYNNGDYNDKIPIGIVLHQNRSTINGVQTFPGVAYGWKQRSFDFIKAFGALKISGYTLSQSGSSARGLLLSGGTSWVDGRNYTINPTQPSYIEEAVGTPTSKIFRYYQSGSDFVYNTNGGAGFTDIDPTQYSNAGTLATVDANKWTIQRVFYFPNSATKALFVYYGNAQYANEADALAAVTTETFTEAPNTAASAIYIGFMLLRHNADFNTAASYEFYAAGLFRGSGAGGGGGVGGGATSLAGLTDVQLTSPTNGQPLVYDTLSTKWINSSALTASLFGTASWATNFVSASNYVLNIATSSFATTGTNTFIGSQTITGSIILPTLVEVTDVNVSFAMPSNPSGIYKVTAQEDPGTIDMGSIIFPPVVEGTSFTIIVTGNTNDVIVSSPYPINARSQDVTLLGNQKIYNFYGISGYWYAGSLSLP